MSEEEQTQEDRIQEIVMRLHAVQDQNADVMRNIILAGGQQFVQPGQVALIKLQALIETVLDTEGRLAVELAFEMKMNDALSSLLEEINKAKLTSGVTDSGIVLPQ